MMRFAMVYVLMVCLPHLVQAQTTPPVISPTRVEFTDLDFALQENGQDIVSGYVLEIWAPGSDTTGANPPLQQTAVMAKNQSMQGSGPVSFRFIPSSVWGIQITQGPTFVGTIKSVGPGGTVRSAPSDPFSFPLPVRAPRAVTGVKMAGGK